MPDVCFKQGTERLEETLFTGTLTTGYEVTIPPLDGFGVPLENSVDVAKQLMFLNTLAVRGGLLRTACNIQHKTGRKYEGEISWTTFGCTPGDTTFNASTAGGTEHITHALGQRWKSADAPDHKGAIGVHHAGSNGLDIEGTDIQIAGLQFQIEKCVNIGTITLPLINTLYGLTTNVNSSPWMGFSAGEIIFLGAEFDQDLERGHETIVYSFEGSPNQLTPLTIGDETVPAGTKFGWDYLWVDWEQGKDAAKEELIVEPRGVYVDIVYQGAPFVLLGI